MGSYCFGIDVGGTTVKCGLFQTDGNLVDKWEIPTRTENKGENILPDVAKAIQDKMAEKDDATVWPDAAGSCRRQRNRYPARVC